MLIHFRYFTSRLWIPLALTAMLIASCSNSSGPQDADNQPEYFPNRVGTTWDYDFPNASSTSPSLHRSVRIVDKATILDGMKVSVAQNTYSFQETRFADTQFVFVDQDSLVIFKKSTTSNALVREHKFLFPLRVGDKVSWSNTVRLLPDGSDFIGTAYPGIGEVVGKDSMLVRSNFYTEVYEILNVSRASVSNSTMNRETTFWISPEVGIIKRSEIFCPIRPYNGGGPKEIPRGCFRDNGLWELSEFSPPTK